MSRAQLVADVSDVTVYEILTDLPDAMLWRGDRIIVHPQAAWPVTLVRQVDADDFAEVVGTQGAALKERPL